MPADLSSTDPLVILEVRDLGGRIEALVRVSRPRYLRTSAIPGLAAAVLSRWPGIERHRCECGSAHGIGAELADTELPHLLEHVALELAVLAGAPRALRGETRWDFARDGKGVFRVSLAYRDPDSGFDDAALVEAALRDGAREVRALVATCERGV